MTCTAFARFAGRALVRALALALTCACSGQDDVGSFGSGGDGASAPGIGGVGVAGSGGISASAIGGAGGGAAGNGPAGPGVGGAAGLAAGGTAAGAGGAGTAETAGSSGASGCSKVGKAGTFQAQMTAFGLERGYYLSVPASYAPAVPQRRAALVTPLFGARTSTTAGTSIRASAVRQSGTFAPSSDPRVAATQPQPRSDECLASPKNVPKHDARIRFFQPPARFVGASLPPLSGPAWLGAAVCDRGCRSVQYFE